jgi:hypothetical protein
LKKKKRYRLQRLALMSERCAYSELLLLSRHDSHTPATMPTFQPPFLSAIASAAEIISHAFASEADISATDTPSSYAFSRCHASFRHYAIELRYDITIYCFLRLTPRLPAP